MFLFLLFLCGLALLVSCTAVPAIAPSVKIVLNYEEPAQLQQDFSASNSTLGFETIFAISSEEPNNPRAWRQKGLLRAAQRAGLRVEIPPQRDFTFKEVVARRDDDPVPVTEGEALCYVAHEDALRKIVDRNLHSALIVEDDADWDVAIRRQIGPVAEAVRLLTDEAHRDGGAAPYGDEWDLLILGHCGETLDPTPGNAIGFPDPTRLSTPLIRNANGQDQYTPWLGDGERVVQRTRAHVCTFAYAVNGRRARKVLDYVRTPGGRAIDLKYRLGCATGALDCVSVVPELIHHARTVGSDALSTKTGQIREDPAAAGRQFTHNVRYSARCNWNRWGRNLRYCLPTWEEWERYFT